MSCLPFYPEFGIKLLIPDSNSGLVVPFILPISFSVKKAAKTIVSEFYISLIHIIFIKKAKINQLTARNIDRHDPCIVVTNVEIRLFTRIASIIKYKKTVATVNNYSV